MGLLDNRNVLLCVTGGIAAYKSAELVRLFVKEGAAVRVAMTESGQKFVSPLTFQALSGKPVLVDIFSQHQESDISHIEAARWPDVIVVAPATANTIGKFACGIADDIVTTILMATRKPIVFAPAMNWAMFQNEMVQANLERLKALPRISIVDPEPGELACGETGRGRLSRLEFILDATAYAAREEKDLAEEVVLVTAGPTYEDIDPVRYIANRSSGKMGFAIAREARARGAKVVLIAGPNHLVPPYDVEVVPVRSAADMLREVMVRAKESNIIIKAAAVADYRPARSSEQKIHKTEKDYHLAMTSTVDILRDLGEKKTNSQFLVGFAAETQQVMESGRNKLHQKRLDMIVINDIGQEGAGFDVETNVVKIMDRKGHIESLPLMAKAEVATVLFDMVQKLRANGSNGKKSAPAASANRGSRRGSRRSGSSRRGRVVVVKGAEGEAGATATPGAPPAAPGPKAAPVANANKPAPPDKNGGEN
jgi:phosphopantothenoylcysteine decarboxylase/phosphopantothenate--cysteine ligase